MRSERLFCEQLEYNLLFRWFLDMGMEEAAFDHSTFSFNRERLLKHEVAQQFFGAVVAQAKKAGLTSSEHFSVDGTLIDAWASLKSFKRKDRSDDDGPPPDDPDAKLARKGRGKEARLSYCVNTLMENRHGLLVDVRVLQATGTAERDAAASMLYSAVPGKRRVTLGADKGYDTKDFVAACRQMNVTPHIAQNISGRRGSAVDGRTANQPGYAISQRKRKLIEEGFGWMKTVACFRKTRFRGTERTQFAAYFVGAAYNLIRMAKLMPAV